MDTEKNKVLGGQAVFGSNAHWESFRHNRKGSEDTFPGGFCRRRGHPATRDYSCLDLVFPSPLSAISNTTNENGVNILLTVS